MRTEATRGWGPFTGRQLTTVICVLAATVLLPAGAWAAVSLTNVSITDPSGVNRVKVTPGGALVVGDPSGALTVDGAVTAVQGLPARPIVIPTMEIDDNFVFKRLYGPQLKRFGITSLTLDSCDSGQYLSVEFYSNVGGATGNGRYLIESVRLQPYETRQLTYPTPLVSTPPTNGTVSIDVRVYAPTTYPHVCLNISGVGIQT